MNELNSKKYGVQLLGLIAGPLLFLLAVCLLPSQFEVIQATTEQVDFSWAGRATLGMMAWMAVWWLTEAVEISVTALLPIAAFPLLGIAKINAACFPYADPLVFLYFGGFVIALSMERWGLGRRLALQTLRMIGTSAPRMIAGFMLVTALISGFVSNTATTAMMLPIALSVIALVGRKHELENDLRSEKVNSIYEKNFATCLLLTIAYSASVGGIATIIGTPTNSFLVGFIREKIAVPYRQDFSFLGWIPIGLPFVVVFLPLMYLTLTRFLFPITNVSIVGGRQLIEDELQRMGSLQRGELNTLLVFSITVAIWLLRPLLTNLVIGTGTQAWQPLANLSDAGIAMVAAMMLFLLPVHWKNMEFTMNWQAAEKMPWGILLLFGGGLSLAAAVQANGVAEFIGSQTRGFGTLPPVAIVLFVTAAVIFLTELTSNAATTASLVPVLAALAPGLGLHPYLLIFPATIAASCAFMLPVATPPNAIVFGSGMITGKQMIVAGFWLNLIGIVLVTLLAMFVIKPWLGI